MRADAQKNYTHLIDTARVVIAEQGADASLRDTARRAGVGLGTLYRHFPTREALLEALLHAGFAELTKHAAELEATGRPEEALAAWLTDTVAFSHTYRGVTDLMMTAIEDPESALHVSCTQLRAAGARLLDRAQSAGAARTDLDGTDLFALIAALAWLGDQPASALRLDHLRDVITAAILPHSATTAPKSPSH
jgi:AcrR family transcriptional regulator